MPHTGKTDPYGASGVDYSSLDYAKRLAQSLAKKTASHLQKTGGEESEESRGESAYVWKEGRVYRAMVMEGLGTKNLIADEMRKITGKTYYDAIAQDTVASIINDLLVVGARPQVISPYWAVGNSAWFEDTKRAQDLVEGWKKACDMAGVTWGGGETPALKGIVDSQTIDLGGAAIGIIKKKKHLVLGDQLSAGDAILLVESNGVHANGLSLIRLLAKKLPKGFATKMDSGTLFGEAVLTPSIIYAKLIQAVQTDGIDIHYMVHITGHGWRKLMRAEKKLRYVIEKLPQPQEVFTFIKKIGDFTDEDMYATFNMGAGFALFVPQKEVEKVLALGKKLKLSIIHAGRVEEGKKEIIIQPKNLSYTSDTLQVR